jgi:gluconate 5-dehydrogenase
MNLFSLSGRRALITGSGRGLGLRFAEALAEAGAEVVINDVDAARAEAAAAGLRAKGYTAHTALFNVTDPAAVRAGVQQLEQSAGPVDILINNAGIHRYGALLELDFAKWQEVLDVNLSGAFLTAQAVAAGMVARRRGKIINIASDAGIVGYAGHAAYGTTKGGLIQMTRILAVEWGPHNVQVNAICPGATWSDMTTPAMQKPEIAEELVARGVAGRITDPEEIGAAAVFLASEASNMIIGQALGVEGGSIAK